MKSDQPIVWYYFRWHYSKGLKEALNIVGNFLWFVTNFFSIKLLVTTLFSPWKKMSENYGDGFDLGKYASAFIINSIMRTVGFITRIFIIAFGIISYLFVLSFSVAILFFWIFAPAILISSLIIGVTFLLI